MQMCNAEIMKKIKLLEITKNEILNDESRTHQVTYQTEKDKVDYGYSFGKTREKITAIDDEVRKLKRLLNHSNATTMVEDFSMTLGECLVYLAQLNREIGVLQHMARKEPTVRHSTYNGVIEYTTLNYDKAECQERLDWVQGTISQLQIAIDRTNLTNMIQMD